MDVDVTTATSIDRDPADVARYAGDPSNAPEWYANIDSVEWRTEPPVRVGSRGRVRGPVPPAPVGVHLRDRRARTRRHLVMRTAEGPFPMETTYTWEPDGGGTRDDAAQPRFAVWVLATPDADDATLDAARQPKGPRGAEGDPRAWPNDIVTPTLVAMAPNPVVTIDPLFDAAPTDARPAHRYGRYRMYAEHETINIDLGRGLLQRHDSVPTSCAPAAPRRPRRPPSSPRAPATSARSTPTATDDRRHRGVPPPATLSTPPAQCTAGRSSSPPSPTRT